MLRVGAVLGQVLDVGVHLVLRPAPVDPLVGPAHGVHLGDLEGLPRRLDLLRVVPHEDEPVDLEAVVRLDLGEGGNLRRMKSPFSFSCPFLETNMEGTLTFVA